MRNFTISFGDWSLTTTVDILSLGVVVGTLVNMLPAIAALLSIVWGILRIYQEPIVQKWLNKEGKE